MPGGNFALSPESAPPAAAGEQGSGSRLGGLPTARVGQGAQVSGLEPAAHDPGRGGDSQTKALKEALTQGRGQNSITTVKTDLAWPLSQTTNPTPGMWFCFMKN